MKLRVLDLFSGIGGFSVGLERTGRFETTAFCEPDDYASEVLKKHWPAIPNIKCGVVGLNSLLKRALMSSRLASPVRIYPLLASAPDLPVPVRDSFGHLCEPFAWFDRQSHCWRTFQRCLVEGWEVFSGTWPRSGMTRNGIAFRRAPLVPLTKGTASGSLLPTPTVSGNHNRKGSSTNSGDGLATYVARNPLPTPRPCSGLRSSGANRTEIMRALEKWPTPTARDWKDGTAQSCRNVPVNGLLGRAVHQGDQQETGGTLNPTWVEWLMGFPSGWTDLDA